MSLDSIYRVLQVILGIGLVIFVHEAGHFFAARLCKVRVEVFSLGFGPRLFGWRRGDTLYQVAAVPIGGYVKMAGELPDGSGRRPDPGDLHSKNVWQRFFIYSGGVIMNVVFALVVFPMVLAAGVPVLEPVISAPTPGTPAWHARLEAGTLILEVDGDEVWDFVHIPGEVALAANGPVTFRILPPGASEPVSIDITPIYNSGAGFRQIGVRPGVNRDLKLVVREGGPAAVAGVRDGDQLLGVVGRPSAETPLEQYTRALRIGAPIELRVRRAGQELEFVVSPEPYTGPDSDRKLLGISMLANLILDVRPNPWIERLGLVKGERILSVDGHPVEDSGTLLAGLLLGPGDSLEGGLEIALGTYAADAPDASGAPHAPGAAGDPDATADPRDRAVRTRVVRSDSRPTADEAVGLVADLYLGVDADSTIVRVQPTAAAAQAGLRSGDRLRTIGGAAVTDWDSVLEEAQRAVAGDGEVLVTFVRVDPASGAWLPDEAAVSPGVIESLDFGIGIPTARGIYRTTGVGQAISEGMTASWRFLTDTYLTLKKMITGDVSPEKMGGIITISAMSYDQAGQGWAKLFFFLCLLSINLAFLNVLPIPVLDGGHLFFCLVEAVKGSPVSERTLGYSQIVGLVLILTLMVYVTYNDVMRFLPGVN